MKLKYIIGATALSLLLAGAAYPQQEQEKEKPAEQQEKPAEKPKEQSKQTPKQQPAEKRQQEQQKQDQHAAKQQQDTEKEQQQTENKQQEQQKQVTKQQQDEQKQQQRQQKQQQQVARQQHQQTDQQQRDAQHSDRDHGRRIPDDRFRASFGREHTFRVERRDDRRFQFGGFWFTYSEPWPVAWAYTDDVYVDYIDGEYYLIDLRHPGVRLLLVVD